MNKWKEVEDYLKKGDYTPVSVVFVRLGQCLPMRKYSKTEVIPNERGVAQLTVEGKYLVARAALEDSDIFNNVTGDNQRTWLNGDVFELFFQPLDREDYYEIHVTPNTYKTQLHFEDYRRLNDYEPEEKIEDVKTVGTVEIHADRNLWLVETKIPLAALKMTADQVVGSRFACCRYNVNHHWEKEELSTTGFMRSGSFHNPPLWQTII